LPASALACHRPADACGLPGSVALVVPLQAATALASSKPAVNVNEKWRV
jgi:hypothetical protein